MWFLHAAAALTFLLGAAHSILGERYILVRLFRRPLPPLFGSDLFTRRTLRFAWHLTTLAWWGIGGMLLVFAGEDATGGRDALLVVVATFLASAALVGIMSRGRHLAWLVLLSVAALAWMGARS